MKIDGYYVLNPLLQMDSTTNWARPSKYYLLTLNFYIKTIKVFKN